MCWDSMTVLASSTKTFNALFNEKVYGKNSYRVGAYIDPFQRILVESIMGIMKPARTS